MLSLFTRTENRCPEQPAFPWEVIGTVKPAPLPHLISVILPVYNHSQYIAAALESILSQQGVNLEVVLVDDASSDNLSCALERFRNREELTIIHKEHNQGLAEAINTGFDNCRGALVTWTSADNIYLPGALRRMQSYLIANPAVGMVYANMETIDDTGELVASENYRPAEAHGQAPLLNLPRTARSLTEYHDNFVGACFLLRHSVWQLVGNFRPEYTGAEDYDFWLRAGRHGEIVRLPESKPFYRYRLHGDTMTASIGSEKIHRAAGNALHAHQQLSQINRFPAMNIHDRPPKNTIAERNLAQDPLFATLNFGIADNPSCPDKPGHCFQFPEYFRRSHSSNFRSITSMSEGRKFLTIPAGASELRYLERICKQSFRNLDCKIFAVFTDGLASADCMPSNTVCVDLKSEYDEEINDAKLHELRAICPAAGPFSRALTYLISGVDALLLLCNPEQDSRPLFYQSLLLRAALAAICHRPLVIDDQTMNLLLGAGRNEASASLEMLRRDFSLLPHIISLSQASNTTARQLRRMCPSGSYEQILQTIFQRNWSLLSE